MVRKSRSTANLDFSLFDLQVMLDKRKTEAENKLPILQARRDRIQDELTEIESEIESLTGIPRERTYRWGKMTLEMAIQMVLEHAARPLSLSEIRATLIERKFVKKPKKTFRAMVSMALGKGEQFKKVERGVYTLKV